MGVKNGSEKRVCGIVNTFSMKKEFPSNMPLFK